MVEQSIDGLVDVVLKFGWRSELPTILGTDADRFYSALVVRDPARAYEIATETENKDLLKLAAASLISHVLEGDPRCNAILELYASFPQPQQKALVPSTSNLFIESLEAKYRLHNVSYKGSVCDVDISKKLLDNGATYTQKHWVERTRDTEFKPPSGPEVTAAVLALYANRDHPDATQRGLVEEVRGMLCQDFRNYWMMTSTRIFYNERGEDEVIHNFGYENERRVKRNIVGPDGFLKENPSFGDATEALIGSRDCTLINNAYSWISGKQAYLLRLNERPKQNVERALVLGDDYDGGFGIGADVGVDGGRLARGWSVSRAKNSP